MFTLDTSTDFGARVARRLAEEEVVWLTTVRENGQPEPSPVWFLWDGSEFLIYSQPNTTKLANIAARPRVSLSFNSTATGGDVVVFAGEARIIPDEPAATDVPAYLDKYRAGITTIGMTPEGFASSYSVPIRVAPAKVRGF
jgi:PPOX class probable F420-dependent enzyme